MLARSFKTQVDPKEKAEFLAQKTHDRESFQNSLYSIQITGYQLCVASYQLCASTHHAVFQWLFKCNLLTSSVSIIKEILTEMQIFTPHSDVLNQKPWGWDLNSVLTNLSGASDACLRWRPSALCAWYCLGSSGFSINLSPPVQQASIWLYTLVCQGSVVSIPWYYQASVSKQGQQRQERLCSISDSWGNRAAEPTVQKSMSPTHNADQRLTSCKGNGLSLKAI